MFHLLTRLFGHLPAPVVVLTLLLSLGLLTAPARAQTTPTPTRQQPLPAQQVPQPTPAPGTQVSPSTNVQGDVRPLPTIVNPPKPDGRVRADTTGLRVGGTPDSVGLGVGRKGAVETTVLYKAKDSIRFEVQNKRAILFDKADVTYGDVNLKAALITVDYERNLVTAEGVADSTGKMQDRPLFTQGAETYQAGRIDYNIKSKRGRITDVVTQQGEGFIHAEKIKRQPNGDINGLHGSYTTCNLEHPHFYINASKMKLIPGQQVITGPFNLVIGDIPTPLGFLFGYFPTPKSNKRASGLIIPTFGQAADRGFFLRNGGYYWAANDHIGVRLTGDIYAGNGDRFGGWRGTAEMQYITRYKYNGLFSFGFNSNPIERTFNSTDANTNPTYTPPSSQNSFFLSWRHTPVPQPGGGRFSASVNLTSSNGAYQRSAVFNQRNYLSAAFQSNITYSKQLRNAPINYSLQLSQTQDTRLGTMTANLPDLTVGLARQYVYDILKIRPRKAYEQLAFSYNLTFQNSLTNNVPARLLNSGSIPLLGGSREPYIVPIKLGNLSQLLRNSQTGMKHDFNITLGSYTVKHINISPGITYNEVWYFKRLEYSYNPLARAVAIDTVVSFNRLPTGSANINLNTSFYGTIIRKGNHKFQALRHKVTPSVGFSYAPGKLPGSAAFQNVKLDDLRDPATGQLYSSNPLYGDGVPFPQFNNFIYGVPLNRSNRRLSFQLQNSVEMKVRNSDDTTGTTPFNKVSLIRDLTFSGGYDLGRDTFQLEPISFSFNTEVARKLTVFINGSLNPYQQDSLGRLRDKYLWQQSKVRLARLTSASLNLSYQFNPSQGNRKSAVKRDVAPLNDPQLGAVTPLNPYEDYVNFEIPWELNTTFGLTYQNQGPLPARFGRVRPGPYTAASLNLNGSVKLTESLRFGFSSNYDFVNKTPAFTRLDLTKDLHCWQINGTWTPFGPARGYFITIAAKSALLQSLKLSRNRTFLNNL
ncbi:putative LPS assembly protein LptD [Hymenobacter psychrophilus]|uniref:putative LPS assembly protein LptD n=1 Tax=Hymenobacter psychrophilus TaxID=651662 RepID=UPI001114FB57|nr:putative LPS assembly protein LptD [Hymenobacter psychrophilus]